MSERKPKAKSKGSGVRKYWEGILLPFLLDYVTLMKLLNLSEIQWPHL
jgi:hypothetical protein